MSTYFYEMLIGKPIKKYTENPMTKNVLPDVNLDETYIIVKNAVDKLSELISNPYDYVKKYIIKNEQHTCEDENEDTLVFNEYESEEISLITISYDTIYKADETEPAEDNLDAFVKTAATAYTFVVSTYNDVTT